MSANNNREGLKASDWAEPIIPNDPRYLPPKTLHDEFAMAALTALIAKDTDPSPENVTALASAAYLFAAAMLEARKVKP